MATSKKAQAAARRARAQEMRRAEQARERRGKILSISVIAVVIAAIVGGIGYLKVDEQRKEEAIAAPVEGEETWDDLGQNHVAEPVDYEMTPAAGGDHHPQWLDCNATVYDEEVVEENAVHSLEHGAVWVTYTDEATDADIETLSDRVSRTPYTFMSPHQGQPAPVMLTAWGHQLKVDEAADPRVERFLEKYVQGEQTPEKGATCSAGNM
jgi:hypothetical protein